MDTKQNKYARDLQDYKTNVVYTWNKFENRQSTPRSILRSGYRNQRRRPMPQRVNFGSTELESSDTASEREDTVNTNTGSTSERTQQQSANIQDNPKQKSKNAGRGRGRDENTGPGAANTKRNLRSAHTK